MTATYEENNLSGNAATKYTLKKMRELIDSGKLETEIRAIYKPLLNGVDGRDSEKVFRRIFDFVRLAVRYQKDINEVETLQTAKRTLSLGFGDCDDQSIITGSMIEGAGFKSRIVLVSNQENKVYHHVFIQAFSGKNWITLDTTEDYFGEGYNQRLTDYYIEGGENDMKLMTLNGLGNQNQIIPMQNTNRGYEQINDSGGNLNGFFPVLMGIESGTNHGYELLPDGTMGWFGSKIVKAVSSAIGPIVSPLVSIAQKVASGAMSVAELATRPLSEVTKALSNELKKLPAIGSVIKIADNLVQAASPLNKINNVIKNLGNPGALIGDALKDIKQAAPFLPPNIGIPLSFAVNFLENPTINPKDLGNLALKSVSIPGCPISVGEMFKAAEMAKTLITDPKKLLSINTALDLANISGIKTPEVLSKLQNEILPLVNQAKEIYNRGENFVAAAAEIEKKATEIATSAAGDIIKVVQKNEIGIQQFMPAIVENAMNMEKMNRLSMIAKGNIVPDVVFFAKYKDANEADALESILSTVEYQGLSKIERISRIYKSVAKFDPTTADLSYWSKFESPESLLIPMVYSPEGNFSKLEATKNAEITAQARKEAQKIVDEQRAKEVWDKTRFVYLQSDINVNIRTIPTMAGSGVKKDYVAAVKNDIRSI